MNLFRQNVLLCWDRNCRSNFLSPPVTVYWHQANWSQCWLYNARCLEPQPVGYQCLGHWHDLTWKMMHSERENQTQVCCSGGWHLYHEANVAACSQTIYGGDWQAIDNTLIHHTSTTDDNSPLRHPGSPAQRWQRRWPRHGRSLSPSTCCPR